MILRQCKYSVFAINKQIKYNYFAIFIKRHMSLLTTNAKLRSFAIWGKFLIIRS